MNKFKVWQAVKFVEEHPHAGKIWVVHMAHDDGSIQVKILKGQPWAGQIISAFAEGVKEYEFPPVEINETSGETPEPPELPATPTMGKPWFPVVVVLVVLVAAETAYLLVGHAGNGNPAATPPVAQTSTEAAQLFLELQTSELNRLNAEDVADLAAVKEARERMESRKSKKEEILRTLTPYR